MPAAKVTKAYKFARPFHGPYRITAVHETGVEVRPVVDLSRILSVWYLNECDTVQNKFLMPSGHGSHKPKNHSQRIHLLLSMTENKLILQIHLTIKKNPSPLDTVFGKDV